VNLRRLTLRSILGDPFRSAAIFVLVCLLTGTSLATTLVLRGAQDSVHLALSRLGADVVVVPLGAEGRVESALLTGMPTGVWMPREIVARLEQVPGVERVSPQLYLAQLDDVRSDSGAPAPLVAFDPDSDFTVRPWLGDSETSGTLPGQAIVGSRVETSSGPDLTVLGRHLVLSARLEPTGAGLDNTVFIPFAEAEALAQTGRLPDVPADAVSAVLVKVSAGSTPEDVAVRIMQDVAGVVPIESPDLFQSFRRQLTGLMRGMLAALAVTWALAIVLVGLIFSMIVAARRREIGVLRALGATRAFVLGSLLIEAAAIGLAGGLAGLATGTLITYLLQTNIGNSVGLPFLFPSLAQLAPLVAAGLGLATFAVIVAAGVPVLRIGRLDPVAAMRD